jgi:hypothetical protein
MIPLSKTDMLRDGSYFEFPQIVVRTLTSNHALIHIASNRKEAALHSAFELMRKKLNLTTL